MVVAVYNTILTPGETSVNFRFTKEQFFFASPGPRSFTALILNRVEGISVPVYWENSPWTGREG